MSATRTYSDEDLTAFLDGEADSDLVQSLEADLGRDDALNARLAGLDIPKQMIASAFEEQLKSAPAMPPLPTPAKTRSSRPGAFWPGLGMGLAAGFALAFAMTTLRQPEPQAPGWLEVVANYQMLYVPETLSSNAVAGKSSRYGQSVSLDDLSKAVGTDLRMLRTVEGLQYRRAQLLGFNGKPLVQVAYTLPDGTPVAICILPSDTEAAGPNGQFLSGLAASDWTTGTHGVVVIGGQDQTTIDSIASQIAPLI